ncbi:MAG: hypothetical protein WCT08_01335 [Patescibacteria group bacterium]|jgi:hypothetical protein
MSDTISDTKQEEQNIVIERLKTLPENVQISVGSEGDFKRDELIQRIERQDPVGMKVVKAQISFLQNLKHGKFYEQIYSADTSDS